MIEINSHKLELELDGVMCTICGSKREDQQAFNYGSPCGEGVYARTKGYDSLKELKAAEKKFDAIQLGTPNVVYGGGSGGHEPPAFRPAEISIGNMPAAGRYLKVDENSQAIKFDNDKLRYDLIPAVALDALAEVFTYGANKYHDRNWEKGMSWGRIFGAMMRHAWAFWRGESHDPESGLRHMAHATWCALALLYYNQTGIGADDRFLGVLPPKEETSD